MIFIIRHSHSEAAKHPIILTIDTTWDATTILRLFEELWDYLTIDTTWDTKTQWFSREEEPNIVGYGSVHDELRCTSNQFLG